MTEQDEVARQVAVAEGYRETFREAAERGRASTGVDEEFVARIEARFLAISQDIRASTDGEVIQNLVERAEELERLRAYVYPPHEIAVQAATSMADMRDWNVPREVLQFIKEELLPAVDDPDLHLRRAALHQIFDFCDAWEYQVEQYSSWVERQGRILLVLLLVAAVAVVVFIWLGYGLLGFIVGGVIGTLTSVLSRLPSMLGWGGWLAMSPRMYGRIGLGLAGTLAGGGLLSIGAVSIIKNQQDFSKLLSPSYSATAAEVLYLVALGVILGFTERMLARLTGLFVDKTVRRPQGNSLLPPRAVNGEPTSAKPGAALAMSKPTARM